jgi:pilus assembly protein CpaE
MRGTVVLVCGPRGGSGRSTIAVNLAVALALQHPEQVGLLDLAQTYGHAALLLNLQPSASVASMPGELLVAPDSGALERYFAVHPSSLRLLAGALQPEELAMLAPARLDALLDCLARRLAYLVIDTSSVFDDLVLAVAARADQVVLVLTPELAAVHGAGECRRVYGGRLGLAADRLRCILNHPQASAALARPDLEQILGRAMDAEVPHGGPLVARAALRGEPLVLADPRGPAARACDRLARTLAGLPVPLDPPAEEPLPLRLRRGARTLLARGR